MIESKTKVICIYKNNITIETLHEHMTLWPWECNVISDFPSPIIFCGIPLTNDNFESLKVE